MNPTCFLLFDISVSIRVKEGNYAMNSDYLGSFQCYILGAELNGFRNYILAYGRGVPNHLLRRIRCNIEDIDKNVFKDQHVWGTFVSASKLKYHGTSYAYSDLEI